MKNARPSRPLFRDAAVRRYVEGQRRGVLPEGVRPPVFLGLWLLAALLLAAGAALACTDLAALGSRSLVDLFLHGGAGG